MNKKVPLIALLLTILSCQTTVENSEPFVPDYSIIPLPENITKADGFFEFSERTAFFADSSIDEIDKAKRYLIQRIETASGIRLNEKETDSGKGIIIKKSSDITGNESYSLKVTSENITIFARHGAGAFYAIQTLLQLLPPEIESNTLVDGIKWRVPAVKINDEPRFEWRGMMLDVVRHFFPKEFMLKYIDNLAKHKINTLHLHLVDDQGWRIEIKKYPKLTEIGAWRVDRENKPWNAREPIKNGEKATYGGFYTQEDMKEIVQYAADRFVTIVPEIEMPGHTSSALAAYPQYACFEGDFSVLPGGYWPITDIYCAGNDSTFIFLQDVLSEVIKLFPSEFVHIGGDEANKTNWKKCPECQQRIKDESLKNEHELQSYFIHRIEKFINANGKRLIGWDEILEGGLAPNATVMSWRGTSGGIKAAQQGNDAVMSPTSHCYFDYYQGNADYEPMAIGGYLPLLKVYEFEPVADKLSAEEAKHILGVQANLWTEYVPTTEHAEYMTFPRISALAEVAWTKKDKRNEESFVERMSKQFQRYKQAGINYAKSSHLVNYVPKIDTTNRQTLAVELKTQTRVPEIRYTTDGSVPDSSATLYTEPLKINKTTTIKAAAFKNGKAISEATNQTFTIHKATAKEIELNAQYGERYHGGGKYGLVNSIRGSKNFGDGIWQGFSGTDLIAKIDFGENTEIENVTVGFLTRVSSWIFLPQKIVVFVSDDGENYKKAGEYINNLPVNIPDVEIHDMNVELEKTETRYLKVVIDAIETCPDWHNGAGDAGWLFVDEIIVQ